MRSAPRFWYWSHDIQPDQVAGLDMPGMRLRRAYHEGPAGWRLAVIAEHARGTSWSVLVDIDADDVSERLEHLQAYPLDLDAVGHGRSVRFASVAAK